MIEQTCQKYKITIKNLYFRIGIFAKSFHIGYTDKID